MKVAVFFSLSLLLALTVVPASYAQTGGTNRPSGRPAAAPAAAAPAKPATSSGGAVAVVDVGEIFKNHKGFNDKMESMKKEVQAYEEELRGRHQSLTQERDKLSQWRPGSPEYDKLERELADKAAKLQVDTQLKKKDFLQREAKVYFEVYQEVNQVIQEFADLHQIDLVLRYNGEEIDPEDRQSVLAGVNRAIVYHRNLDITGDILDRLNRAPRVSRAPATPKR